MSVTRSSADVDAVREINNAQNRIVAEVNRRRSLPDRIAALKADDDPDRLLPEDTRRASPPSVRRTRGGTRTAAAGGGRSDVTGEVLDWQQYAACAAAVERGDAVIRHPLRDRDDVCQTMRARIVLVN